MTRRLTLAALLIAAHSFALDATVTLDSGRAVVRAGANLHAKAVDTFTAFYEKLTPVPR